MHPPFPYQAGKSFSDRSLPSAQVIRQHNLPDTVTLSISTLGRWRTEHMNETAFERRAYLDAILDKDEEINELRNCYAEMADERDEYREEVGRMGRSRERVKRRLERWYLVMEAAKERAEVEQAETEGRMTGLTVQMDRLRARGALLEDRVQQKDATIRELRRQLRAAAGGAPGMFLLNPSSPGSSFQIQRQALAAPTQEVLPQALHQPLAPTQEDLLLGDRALVVGPRRGDALLASTTLCKAKVGRWKIGDTGQGTEQSIRMGKFGVYQKVLLRGPSLGVSNGLLVATPHLFSGLAAATGNAAGNILKVEELSLVGGAVLFSGVSREPLVAPFSTASGPRIFIVQTPPRIAKENFTGE
ncbi:MAG: hypothetical protein M1836_004327 [Candelina mexicana]|nr:MAG: hypothetical protein M1836_004327 [Candelina mexicana]